MIRVIGPDGIDRELFDSRGPVLAAFLGKGEGYGDQVRCLESLSSRFGGRLKVCLADAHFLATYFRRLRFAGTPFFVLVEEGRERSRFFGRADREDLERFVLDNWSGERPPVGVSAAGTRSAGSA